MKLRRYQPRDSEAVRRLNEEVIRAAGTDPEDIPHADDVEDVEGAYIETGGEFLVVEREDAGSEATESSEEASGETASSDGEVVGMGGLRVDGDEGELFRMRVALDRQREGIGSRLLDALEDAARERGVERLRAETAKRQSAAVSFYPRNGYERVDADRRGEYTVIGYEKQL